MWRRGGGAIVNLASTSSLKGAAYMLHYTSSKGAVQAMTRSGLPAELVDYQPCYRSEAGTGCAMAFVTWGDGQ